MRVIITLVTRLINLLVPSSNDNTKLRLAILERVELAPWKPPRLFKKKKTGQQKREKVKRFTPTMLVFPPSIFPCPLSGTEERI